MIPVRGAVRGISTPDRTHAQNFNFTPANQLRGIDGP